MKCCSNSIIQKQRIKGIMRETLSWAPQESLHSLTHSLTHKHTLTISPSLSPTRTQLTFGQYQKFIQRHGLSCGTELIRYSGQSYSYLFLL